ncbi:MAG: 3'-5' exonuclease [Bacilli bacterium]|nr:3'-5' exonuclease [Bacilli bacterium]
MITAIDFETADSHSESACSVGLAKFDEEGQITNTKYSLIKPPEFCNFNGWNTKIHGIRRNDVREAPSFSYLWPDLEYFLGEDLLIAHNAPFDMSVLVALLDYYQIEVPHIPYLCTLQLSRRVWPRLTSHALTYLSEYFDLPYNAHNALDDAQNCGKLFAKACNSRMYDKDDLKKFLKSKKMSFGYLDNFAEVKRAKKLAKNKTVYYF